MVKFCQLMLSDTYTKLMCHTHDQHLTLLILVNFSKYIDVTVWDCAFLNCKGSLVKISKL